jgi:hypothetical protein
MTTAIVTQLQRSPFVFCKVFQLANDDGTELTTGKNSVLLTGFDPKFVPDVSQVNLKYYTDNGGTEAAAYGCIDQASFIVHAADTTGRTFEMDIWLSAHVMKVIIEIAV